MRSIPTYHSYQSTGLFSKLVEDYISGGEKLKKYISYSVDFNEVARVIENRKKSKINRSLLVQELENIYGSVQAGDEVSSNIRSLSSENTFTVCAAHQPNIFTGHMYFIYKIIHAIRVADELNGRFPDSHFVPVYFMGSEDADLDELGQVVVDGKNYKWQTDQKGAVGRMKVDKAFISMIDELEIQFSGTQFGASIIKEIRVAFTENKNIDKATFEFVNQLFGKYGLIVFIPDNAQFKQECKLLFKKELEQQFSAQSLSETLRDFPVEYKIQTKGRDINLFYLKDGIRERIEKANDEFVVSNTNLHFSLQDILNELELHPERFSPNVILRPVMQEMLLPNIAFIGGGGELAYWLELKKVFEVASVHFPMLVLRNSFLLVDKTASSEIKALSLQPGDFFRSAIEITNQHILNTVKHQLGLADEKSEIMDLYNQIVAKIQFSDPTLSEHAKALKAKALKQIDKLEKKQMRAERRKVPEVIQKIETIKNTLFPDGVLQERVENMISYYAKHGPSFFDEIYQNSKALDQEFCILEIT